MCCLVGDESKQSVGRDSGWSPPIDAARRKTLMEHCNAETAHFDAIGVNSNLGQSLLPRFWPERIHLTLSLNNG